MKRNKIQALAEAALINKSIVNANTNTIYIPDITIEPNRFHGFNVKKLKEEEITNALSDGEDTENLITMYCMDTYPAAGTCSSDRMGWIPMDLEPDDDDSIVEDAIVEFLSNLSDDEIGSLMTEEEFIERKRK